jgi:TPR repeat protein
MQRLCARSSRSSAADLTDPSGCIGDAFQDKEGGNLNEALIWYRRAADRGDVDALVTLGLRMRKVSGFLKIMLRRTNASV